VLQKNPKAQQALQGDQIFQILFQNYTKQLQFSIDQEKNAQIGRIGCFSSLREDSGGVWQDAGRTGT